MNDYHYAWLLTHPERTEEWLQEKLREGFDIHHMDGDHGNNSPDNLVLIEHVDHFRLHGCHLAIRLRDAKRARLDAKEKRRLRTEIETIELGRRIYESRKKPMAWRDAFRAHCAPLEHGSEESPAAIRLARRYAMTADVEWPPAVAFQPTPQITTAERLQRRERREKEAAQGKLNNQRERIERRKRMFPYRTKYEQSR